MKSLGGSSLRNEFAAFAGDALLADKLLGAMTPFAASLRCVVPVSILSPFSAALISAFPPGREDSAAGAGDASAIAGGCEAPPISADAIVA